MKTVVSKLDLISKLKQNREEHRKIYQLAIEKYREKAIEEFNSRIDQIKRTGEVDRMIRLPVPEEHTADYDATIEMLEWSTDDVIELGEVEFRQYVFNEWGWAHSFASNSTSYISG